MKKRIFTAAIIIACVVISPLLAQEKIYKLKLKEQEIENSIRSSLSPYLKSGDYVVKAKIVGLKVSEAASGEGRRSRNAISDPLPGFELEDKSSLPQIVEVVKNTYWKIKSLRVDLIMHKEVSSSVDMYIQQTVPVIAELDPSRGDQFNFVPIIPKTKEDTYIEEKKVEEKSYYGLAAKEWGYIIALALLGFIALLMAVRMITLRRNLNALVDAIDNEEDADGEGTDGLIEEIQKRRSDRKIQQEEQLSQELLNDENEKISQEIITQLVGRPDWSKQMVEEFKKDKKGLENLAQFISILGTNISRKIFTRCMDEENYLNLEKMSEELTLKPDEQNKILREIQKILYTKQLISPEKDDFNPFAYLDDLSPNQVFFLIKEEPVKVKAIILSKLNGEAVSTVLERLPKMERNKVAIELGKMGELPFELAEKVAFTIAKKLKNVPDEKVAKFDGVTMLLDVLSESEDTIRTDIINNLRVSDKNLSRRVESRFFLFDSIPVVPMDILTNVIRRLQTDDVITAIVGASKQLQEKVIMCFPEKSRRTLVASLKSRRPTVEEIKAKRRLVISGMQEMAAGNQVDLQKIQAAWEKVKKKTVSAS